MSSETSFPFLKIARDHNVPYGVVIRLAEHMPLLVRGKSVELDDQTAADFDRYRSPKLIGDICYVLTIEQKRRANAV